MSNKLATMRGRMAMLLLLLTPGVLVASSDLRLVEAVKNQDKAAVQTLLKQQVDVNAPQPDGATPLLWAAQWDDLEIAELLIRAGANVNAANQYGVTPLSMACTNGSAAMVETLLKAGAEPNLALPTGETPLMTAARTGRLDAVKVLLARGVDVNAREAVRGQTALMWAVSEQHRDVAQTLIEDGADVRAASTSGFTPLMFAVRQGDLDATKMLMAHGADVNETASDGVSVLHVATVRGQVALAEFLLDHGANANADGPGYTPLHWAVGTWETFMTLAYYHLESGEWSVLGGLPTREGKLRLIRGLLAKGADVNARLKNSPPYFGDHIGGGVLGGGSFVGGTPFFIAANTGDIEIMRLLMAQGADPLLTTKDKTTPLMVAAGLATAEAMTRIPESSRLEATKLCMDLGADPNAANNAGNTPLHATAFLGFNTIARFLLDNGVAVNPRNKNGETPVKIAEGFENQMQLYIHESTASLLRTWGGVTQ